MLWVRHHYITLFSKIYKGMTIKHLKVSAIKDYELTFVKLSRGREESIQNHEQKLHIFN